MKKGLWLLVCFSLFSSTPAIGQTILVLSSQDADQLAVEQGFESAFSDRFEVINLEASEEKLRKTGESLSAKPPGLLLVAGNSAAQMAKWYLEDVPMIYCSASRAEAMELKGSKVYGIFHTPSLEEQFSALVSTFPERKKVGLLYNPRVYQEQVRSVAGQASGKGVELVQVSLTNIKEVPVKTREIVTQVELLWALEDPELITPHTFPYIILQSIQQGVPVFSGNQAMAKGGATAALAEDAEKTGSLLADLAKKVLEGETPSQRIQYPPGQLIINNKTAAVMKIQFPAQTIGSAAEVIE